jgi:GDP-4-dehydro-6-deoxy-D-mannose reductase
MKSRVLITGINGFTGRYLADYLNQQGYEVWGLDRSERKENNYSNINFYLADICEQQELQAILEECQPESIYHLAAQSSVGLSWQQPAPTMNINLEGCITLLETARLVCSDCRVLLAGSGEEYGPVSSDNLPINEYCETNPQNPYSLSKLFQGMVGMHYARTYKMQIYIVRAFNHTGPGQAQGFVVPDFAAQVASIEAGLQAPVIKVGNLSAQRDFSDVRDVIRAYHSILEKGIPARIYNVGAGKAIPIYDILDYLIFLCKESIQVEVDEKKFRPVDVPVLYSDTSRIKEETGWQPTIPLEETLKDTLNYWRNQVRKGNVSSL